MWRVRVAALDTDDLKEDVRVSGRLPIALPGLVPLLPNRGKVVVCLPSLSARGSTAIDERFASREDGCCTGCSSVGEHWDELERYWELLLLNTGSLDGRRMADGRPFSDLSAMLIYATFLANVNLSCVAGSMVAIMHCPCHFSLNN